MSKCILQKTRGHTLDVSATAFTNAVKKVTSKKYLKKKENHFNNVFHEYLQANMVKHGIEGYGLENFLDLNVFNNKIIIHNYAPLTTLRYEFGYSGDDLEDFDYMTYNNPKYYIRPTINETFNYIGQTLCNDIATEFNKQLG